MNIQDFKYSGKGRFSIQKSETKIDDFYDDTDDYEQLLAQKKQQIDDLQTLMYAHNRYGLLVILQAMDAAGKDGTIKHVLSGVNPIGLRVESFKRPSETELSHDFMWRHILKLPERGNITIFNRSYYEEVLVVKVHPEILQNYQKIPAEFTESDVWQNRYEDIKNYEQFLHRNGIKVVKIFLNVSKKEQAERLIERIEDPTKNWKFEEQDVKERAFWDNYQQAYEDCINATASEFAPWYVVPADDKKNMRLVVSQILSNEMEQLKMNYPETTADRKADLERWIEVIKGQ